VNPTGNRPRAIHWIAVLSGVALLTACTSPSAPPIRPPGAAAAPEEDDGRLWLAASVAEESILPAEVLYADTALQQYVEKIAERLGSNGLAVRANLSRGRRRLRDLLGDRDG